MKKLLQFNNVEFCIGSEKTKRLLTIALSLIFLVQLSVSAQAQELDWAKQAGGPISDSVAAIAVDGTGNSYVTGNFSGTVTFGEGTGAVTLTAASSLLDLYVAKYDSSGNLLWARRAGGTSTDDGLAIDVDTVGNSYVTGRFGGIATFGEGTDAVTLTTPFFSDIFVAKYDSSGNLVWAKQAGDLGLDDIGFGIAVDAVGNSYVTGFFRGTATFGEGINATMLTSAGNHDIFVAKYDSSGNLVWAKQAGGSAPDIARGIAVDTAGNSLVTGNIQGTVTFGEGDSTTTLTSIGSSDIFVVKYDSDGNLVWAKQAGGSAPVGGQAVAVDGNGNSYVTGSIQGTTTFGAITLTSANVDIFVAKYDPDGNVLWAKRAGSSFFDLGTAIAADEDGKSTVTGHFDDPTATFGEGANTVTLTSVGTNDIFIARYDPNGNLLWAKSVGSQANDDGRGIAVDGAGNSYVTGVFGPPTATFGEGENTTVLTSFGFSDIFIAKLGGVNSTPLADAGGPYSGVEGSAIVLNNASASDSDGDALTFAWTVDSPLCNFSESTVLHPSLICLDNGSYIATLMVNDGVNDSVSSVATVTVDNAVPIIISVSNDGPILPGASATITVTASDPAGTNDPLQYEFDCDDDSVFEVGPQTNNTANCSFSSTGSFIVNVRVTDDDGGQSLGSTIVTVLTPQQAIGDLIDDVQTFVDAGILNQGQGNALSTKLEAAIKKLDQGMVDPAVNQLQAFTNQINAFINAGILTPAQGQQLIEAANEIINQLGGMLLPKEGGTLVLAARQMLTINNSTFNDPVRIIYVPLDPITTAPLQNIGIFFELNAAYLDGSPAQPQQSYEITIGYEQNAVPSAIDEAQLALYSWNGGAWSKEPTTRVDTEANTITTLPDHFSLWAVLANQHPIYLPIILK